MLTDFKCHCGIQAKKIVFLNCQSFYDTRYRVIFLIINGHTWGFCVYIFHFKYIFEPHQIFRFQFGHAIYVPNKCIWMIKREMKIQ